MPSDKGSKNAKVAKTTKNSKSNAKSNAKSVKEGGVRKAPAKKVPAKKVAKVDDDKKNGTRYFKIADMDGGFRGRFSGRKPKQAANKALTSILKENNDGGATKGKIKFSIVECTRGSNCKQYNYVGERKKLPDPMVVKIGEKEIKYEFSNVVKKAVVPKPAKKDVKKEAKKVARRKAE